MQPIKITSFKLGLNLDTISPVITDDIAIDIASTLNIQFEFEYLQLLPLISRKYDVKYGDKLPNV